LSQIFFLGHADGTGFETGAAKPQEFCARVAPTKNHEHRFVQLLLIACKVEDWITNVIFTQSDLAIPMRPYRRLNGWEQMIWPTNA